MKVKVNVLAKPHPCIFFSLQEDSMLELASFLGHVAGGKLSFRVRVWLRETRKKVASGYG